MAKYTNNFNVPLSAAAWLLHDSYDHEAKIDPNVFSVTEILKPVRQIILNRRVAALPKEEQLPTDVSVLFNARMGQSVHTAVEETWLDKDRLPDILGYLGISKFAASKIQINPSPEELDPNGIFLYMEQRRTVEVNEKYKLTGQYDFNFNGQLEDFKYTKTYALTMGVNDDYYAKQGSMYRFIFPDQVLSDTTNITFLFSDWMASRVGSKDYPANPIWSKQFPLMSPLDTRTFIDDKFEAIDFYMDKDEKDLPHCTSEELWESPTVWKYYANPENKARATKNFDNAADANAHLSEKGKGVIDEVKGEIKACAYCPAFVLCTQKDKYLIEGRLKV